MHRQLAGIFSPDDVHYSLSIIIITPSNRKIGTKIIIIRKWPFKQQNNDDIVHDTSIIDYYYILFIYRLVTVFNSK